MSDIRIYDFEFKLLYVCNNYISSNWSIFFNDIGTFEAHFSIDDNVAQVLFSNDYLVAVQDGKSAIITGKQLVDDIAVYGRTPNWIFSKRITLPFEEMSGNVEELTRNIISTAYDGENVVGDGKVIVWGDSVYATEVVSLSRSDSKTTFEVLRDCLMKDSAGHRLTFEPLQKRWVYTVIKGRTLPIVVSEDNLNAHDTQYTSDCLDYFSGGWYQEEQPEDENGNKPEPIWKRIEGDSAKTGLYRWDSLLSGKTETEAKDGLLLKTYNKKIAVQTHNLVWGRDYELGDTVLVKIIKGKLEFAAQKQIKGVNIWEEHTNSGEQPIFEE